MSIVWDPEDRKPALFSDLEAQIRHAAPYASVKLTFADGAWLVRALNPAAMCQRGGDFLSRDVSAAVAEVLIDNDVPALVRRPTRAS